MTETVSHGKEIALEFTVKLEDNQVVATTVGGKPISYTQGTKQIIPGVESAVEGMMIGQAKQVVIAPTDGFGERDPNAVQEIPKEKVPNDVKVGTQLHLKGPVGEDARPTVAEIKDSTVVLDFNHPLAGKTLVVDLKVVNIT